MNINTCHKIRSHEKKTRISIYLRLTLKKINPQSYYNRLDYYYILLNLLILYYIIKYKHKK